MPYYLNAEHKFNVGDLIKFKNSQSIYECFTVLGVVVEKLSPEMYDRVDIGYMIRDRAGRSLIVREIEIKAVYKEEDIKDEVENQTTTPSDSF